MNWMAIAVVGVGLSMDAFGVTLANAMQAKGMPWYRLMVMPIAFGLFQALMPLLGAVSGGLLRQVIGDYGHIVTALVLGVIGVLMLRECFRDEEASGEPLNLTVKVLILQAIATSIDAFVVGIGFGVTGVPLVSVVLIGAITFVIVTGGLVIGRYFGEKLGRYAQALGGVLLLIIAIKSLF